MTFGLIACVEDATEAAAAMEAGFAGVLGPPPPASAAGRTGLVGRIEGGLLILEGRDPPPRLVVVRDRSPDDAMLDGLAAQGHAGLLLATAARLFDAFTVADLVRIVDRLRAAGLLTAFAGGLEAPDIPRLAALGADLLLIGRGLRAGAALDAERMRAVVLVAAGEPARSAPPTPTQPLDRIFVRDLVRTLPIGAYDSERGRDQRVRFSVEAALAPVDRAAHTMADIVSYDLITDAISRASAGPHTVLVETLAESVAALLLRVPRIALVRVRVEKLDLEPGAVGIEIERRKDDARR